MLINCKNCKGKFILRKSEFELEDSLITCEHCKKEWIYEPRSHYLENKLSELDKDLKNKEIKINEENIKHNEKIELLENDLKIKNEELSKQKLLEERIAKFEKRITDTEKLNSYQADLEIQKAKLEDQIKTTSENIINKNNDIEKKANYLEMKINSDDFDDMSIVKKSIAVNDAKSDVVNIKNYDQEDKTKKIKKKHSFFWSGISNK